MNHAVRHPIVSAAMGLRRSHPSAPALSVLDAVMEGRLGSHPDFDDPSGDFTLPPSCFARVLRDAFDPSISDAALEAGVSGISHEMSQKWDAVLREFSARYELWRPRADSTSRSRWCLQVR